MLRGLMMDVPLLVSSVLRHAATYHGDSEIVSRTVEGPIHRYTYAEAAGRSARLAHALARFGVAPGDRIGTLAWNGYRHLECYFAAAGSGLVCHTINPRLFPEQIGYIINHASDALLFTDLSFIGLLEGIAEQLTGLKAIVVMTDAEHMPVSAKLPGLLCYETLLAAESDRFDWPVFDENTAAGMCYTSGTTGNPKGVLYSHRSSLLHAMAVSMPDALSVSALDTVMPVVPMFHVNAWGLPYAAPMAGARLVLPGARMDGASLHDLISSEGVTLTAGVPTVWMGLLDWADRNGQSLEPLQRLAIGGSACPPAMIERFGARGVRVIHAWGMTETSPIGLTNTPKRKHRDQSEEQRLALAAKQGRPLFGMEFRVVDADGRDVARDGVQYGRMLVRGAWVCARYFGLDDSAAHEVEPGWFETGDIVTIDSDGYVQIVDRTKDVIKSGGEWISSIELENVAVAHPAVAEAAVVAVPDPKWSERPLLVIVPRDGRTVTREEIIEFYQGKVAKWCIPDQIMIVEELPHTATGKLLKMKIRQIVLDRLAAPAGAGQAS